jgi:hypothetical protein
VAAGIAGAIPPFCTECPQAKQALPTAAWTPFTHGGAVRIQHCFTGVPLTPTSGRVTPDHPRKQKHDEAGEGTCPPVDQSQSSALRT